MVQLKHSSCLSTHRIYRVSIQLTGTYVQPLLLLDSIARQHISTLNAQVTHYGIGVLEDFEA
eukprot:scaffold15035_cov407-Alexandrium_tamarense.AAC.1